MFTGLLDYRTENKGNRAFPIIQVNMCLSATLEQPLGGMKGLRHPDSYNQDSFHSRSPGQRDELIWPLWLVKPVTTAKLTLTLRFPLRGSGAKAGCEASPCAASTLQITKTLKPDNVRQVNIRA